MVSLSHQRELTEEILVTLWSKGLETQLRSPEVQGENVYVWWDLNMCTYCFWIRIMWTEDAQSSWKIEKKDQIDYYVLFPYPPRSESGSMGERHFPLWKWANQISRAWHTRVFQWDNTHLPCSDWFYTSQGSLWFIGWCQFPICLRFIIFFLIKKK